MASTASSKIEMWRATTTTSPRSQQERTRTRGGQIQLLAFINILHTTPAMTWDTILRHKSPPLLLPPTMRKPPPSLIIIETNLLHMINTTEPPYRHRELRHNNKVILAIKRTLSLPHRKRDPRGQGIRGRIIRTHRQVEFKTMSEITTKERETGHGTIQPRRPHLLHVAEEKALQAPMVHSEPQARKKEVSTIPRPKVVPKRPCSRRRHLRLWCANTAR